MKEKKPIPGDKALCGAFGNNDTFLIPAAGDRAAQPHRFSIGPMECELTGPMLASDGRTLILAVQYPGALHGMRQRPGVEQRCGRPERISSRDGRVLQQRIVPIGSNFPFGPRPDTR